LRGLRRIGYYLMSLGTLLRGVHNWPVLITLLRKSHAPVMLQLRDGTRYRVRSLMDAWIVKETNLDGDYARFGTPLHDGWNILDIGAGLGDFTVYAARRAPRGRVVAYEPSPESVALLEENLELNRAGNVAVFQRAVAASRGTLNLDVSGGVAVQFRTTGAQTGASIAVPSVTLADALAELPGGTCDFLKMDCEGAEYDILFSAGDTVLPRVQRICLEYHDFVTPYSHDDLVRYFATRGWHVALHPSPVRRELGFLYVEAPKGLTT
jgi:FkbM family methyltransferase